MGVGTSPDSVTNGARPRVGVVLAAGRSQRLSKLTKGRSKAVVRIGGVSLVERAVRTLEHAGCERVVVVVGYRAKEVGRAARHAGGRVEVVVAPDWGAGNGASLSAAERAVEGESSFVVLCGDHTFSPGALEPLLESGSSAVLVDPRPSPEAWAEGTRVQVRDGTAVAFAKSLQDPAIDCGVFVLPQSVFAAARAGASEGDHSLAGAVTRLAGTTPIRAVSLAPGAWWQDVDTPADLRAAKRLVRRSLVKDTDGPVSRYLNRPISTRITMALAPLHIPPNVFTVLILIVGVWAAWSLSASRAVVGAILTQAVSILDGVDGETARLLDRTTRFGAQFDALADRAVDAAIVAGLWLWSWDDPSRTFRIEMIAVAMIAWMILTQILYEPFDLISRFDDREVPPATALLGARDSRLLLIAGVSLFDQPVPAFLVGAFAYLSSGLHRILLVGGKRGGRDAPSGLTPPDEVRETA